MFEELRSFLRYWVAIRGDRDLPSRRDIDPLDIDPKTLPYVFLMEFAPNDTEVRFSLVGSHTRDAIGRELTGRSSRDLETTMGGSREAFHEHVLSFYRLARKHRAPVHSRGTYLAGHGAPTVVTERLTCPLLGEDGITVKFAGVQRYAGPVAGHLATWRAPTTHDYQPEFVRPLTDEDIHAHVAPP